MTVREDAASALPRSRFLLLGVPFDVVDLEGAAAVAAHLAASGGPHLIVTANPEAVVAAQEDAPLAAAMSEASLVVADGIGIVWASRRLGQPLPARVPGIELLDRILAAAAAHGESVYFLGGEPGVAEAAAARARARHPGLVVAGTHHGYFRRDPRDETALVAEIRASAPTYVFAGLGMPLQETWLHRQLPALGAHVAMGVGGSFDVLSGRVARAPEFFRRLHAEWLYRLLRQPSRWRRQLALLRFLRLVLRQARRARP